MQNAMRRCWKHWPALRPDQQRKKELLEMASVCRRVPAHAPKTFHEALQYYWFVHLAVITELNPWDSFNPGRLDQHLYPFYKREIEAGTLTREKAVELLQSFWIKFNNHPAPPKVGVTALESNTYTDFCLINLGGVKPDGSDAVNELTFILLDVIEEMRLAAAQFDGAGQQKESGQLHPAHAGDHKDRFRPALLFQYGCHHPGTSQAGKGYRGCTQRRRQRLCRSRCFRNGKLHPAAAISIFRKCWRSRFTTAPIPGPARRWASKQVTRATFKVYTDLLEAFNSQLNHFTEIKIRGNNTIHRIFADYMPAPFLSLIIDDCIANGKDYNNGGARYNTTYIQGVGLGSVTDMLTALKYHVFDKKPYPWMAFLKAMENNFRDFEEFRVELVYNTPKIRQ